MNRGHFGCSLNNLVEVDVGFCKEQDGPYEIDFLKMTDAEVEDFNKANGIDKKVARLIYGKSYMTMGVAI